ncbi:MAG: hypothetical protein COV55_04370 [Candidatus Komeilibacteria bacterium CG11_big_fil_rev_8_21_14_0_20_36_20]|uniref:Uncharacterized protein n=1 Tax=Candidatus Komeilibacteria bacterium CG11_big_fil_rev_8_21_14_0_20_36_20 TaxID=1974477 RepID=A0A2H0NE39_9BACT|nr:MAG: hypothetical protein COV55_04370 [Candidatus Komeilibacteria bacterium CG11_big_fil_rev_8_21_14_0_20_36_20]PIR81478.1 MAG: hypothetical protein COU21_03600 [Candidatus Komeilibacteria bacterium CG10_big_fil_rev_8_21_14_0_10_36_65]PJC55679.1 MAG: hypothetical protein CO027_00955 [Candidatus Komeilibacteria bacterium CG_4_9_14_0_2_um_filter_36_13]
MPDLVNIEKTPISPEQSVESAEQKTAPEKSPEQFTEKKAEQDASAQSVVLPDDSDSQDKTKISTSTVTLRKVESILSRDMDKVFLSMDAATQQKFKIKGEETARQITTILQKGKFKVKQIINLIVGWLRIIPRVNKHYIEQEAKIKADLIIKMHQNKK